MKKNNKTEIKVSAKIASPLGKVWELWTLPEHIIRWNNAADDWHTPRAENDLKEGGRFCYRMEAKDDSFGFDFSGVYNKIIQEELIVYTIDDGRIVQISFKSRGNFTEVIEIFEAEDINEIEKQRSGWQAILDNFKKYAEVE